MIDDDDEVDLAPFARALREETAGADRELVVRTRERVVASAQRRARRPRFTMALAAAAILFGASTAWAVWSGAWRWPGDDDAPAIERPARSDAPLPHDDAPVIAEPVAPDQALPTESPFPGPLPAPSPADERSRYRAPVDDDRHAATARPVIPAEDEAPIDPAERRAYDEADRLQFTAHDWPLAVAAWDAYLASFPDGRYVPEARWSRAVALVRAGRTAEARAALEPIAAGSLAGYRRREAASLLEALAP